LKKEREHKAKTLPDLLRRRWNEVTAHTINPENPGTISGLFQLALYLDVGVRDLVILAHREKIRLDAGRPVGTAARLNKIGEESFVEGNTMDSLMDMSVVNADSHLRVFPTSFFNWLVYDKDENVWLTKFKRETTKYTRKAIPKTLARADEVRRFFVPCNIDSVHWWLLFYKRLGGSCVCRYPSCAPGYLGRDFLT